MSFLETHYSEETNVVNEPNDINDSSEKSGINDTKEINENNVRLLIPQFAFRNSKCRISAINEPNEINGLSEINSTNVFRQEWEYLTPPLVYKLEGGNMKDHKKMYGIYLRAGLLSSLVIFILLFIFVPYAQPLPYELKHEVITMVEDISSYIDKYEEPPPAERPKVVAPAENIGDENVVETIPETEFTENPIRTRPVGPEIEIVPYYRVEVKPQPVVQAKPRYPDLVRRAGIEGQTVVKALVDIDGSIMEVQVLKSSGNQMLDEAALAAARNWKFSPARQRDKYVRVYVSIPVNFKLVDSGS